MATQNADLEVIDFNNSEEYELGDTHLTTREIAGIVELTPNTVRTHRKDGMLTDCTVVRISHKPGALAFEYGPALHAFIQYYSRRSDCKSRTVRGMREHAYMRQMRAQEMKEQGQNLADICHALDVSPGTARRYLKGKYDRPEPIEGHTPVWERDAQPA